MTRAQDRVDPRSELAELADERAEAEVPPRSGRYLERMAFYTTPTVEVDDDGALSYTTRTGDRGPRHDDGDD